MTVQEIRLSLADKDDDMEAMAYVRGQFGRIEAVTTEFFVVDNPCEASRPLAELKVVLGK